MINYTETNAVYYKCAQLKLEGFSVRGLQI